MQLKNLNQLDLSFNKITTIKSNTFMGEFSNNIIIISEVSNKGMEKLDTLNLNNNKIEGLGPRYFEGMSRLTSLQLDYNKINHVNDEAFYGLEGRHQNGFQE